MILRHLQVHPDDHRPAYVVWELTLRCDQPCKHCGSRAGPPRPDELSTEEALRVVEQLAALRTLEVTLVGGEAYLYPGFLEVVRALKAHGIRPSMVSGGRRLSAEMVRAMADAGMYSVSLSIDGLETTHDLVRSGPGGFAATTAALGALKAAGIRIGANTSLNRLNQGELEGLYDHLRNQGITGWQVQLTVPIGRAADRPDLLLQPWDLLDVMPRLAALKQRGYADGILVMPGNNLGYFGPEEALLRSTRPGDQDHWFGCQAGRFILGVESNGGLKGCLSLQSECYVGGNTRAQPLATSWQGQGPLAFNRTRGVEDLWGFCRTCTFAEVCKAGCTFAAHAVMGRPGNNPYCHYRARTLARQGLRERLVVKEAAPGKPFDHAQLEVVQEPFDAPDSRPTLPREMLQICHV